MDFSLLNAVSNLERPDGVIAIPGDGCYALCGRLDRPASLERMHRIKGVKEPMLLLGYDIAAFKPYLDGIPAEAEALMHRYWPGPLVLFLSKSHRLPEPVTLRSKVAIMQPNCEASLGLLSMLPGGIVATVGAARYDDLPAMTALGVFHDFGDDVDYVLNDDANVRDSRPATVISVDPDGAVHILRSGPVMLD